MMSRTVVIAGVKPSRPRAGREALRRWFEQRRDAYPWRGVDDPYAILVSEVMLQQTRAPRVVPAYRAFLQRFPTVFALAGSTRAEVVRAWDGLGYNRRAVALSEASRRIVGDHGGRVPSDPGDLVRLPGVGAYTAAAVASLAFGVPVAAVDTNVRRVVARFHLGLEPAESAPREIGALAQRWLDRRDPGAWNAAVMDLGREVCRPHPRCDVCPLARPCRFRAAGRTGGRGARRQGPFEGSQRQVRGAVVRALLEDDVASMTVLAARTGFEAARVDRAVEGLVGDGLLERLPSGRVRLAR